VGKLDETMAPPFFLCLEILHKCCKKNLFWLHIPVFAGEIFVLKKKFENFSAHFYSDFGLVAIFLTIFLLF
jgi:hypothetical protein